MDHEMEAPMTSVEDDRGMLMNVAYRLVGSVSDAEDAVQEAFTRWYAQSDSTRIRIESPTAWLVTVTTRICLDVLGSARVRRERYVGEWLPEPVPDGVRWTSQATADRIDPADRISLDESLGMALLVVLESMTPAERVAFVLHDVFRYTFAEVAEIVGRSPAACRQLATAARRRLRSERAKRIPAPEHARVVSVFKEAMASGDLTALIEMLDPNAIAIADGGGKVAASRERIEGAETIAGYLLDLYDRGLRFQLSTVNGRVGLVAADPAGDVIAVASLSISAGRIGRIWVTRNPDKLAIWNGRN